MHSRRWERRGAHSGVRARNPLREQTVRRSFINSYMFINTVETYSVCLISSDRTCSGHVFELLINMTTDLHCCRCRTRRCTVAINKHSFSGWAEEYAIAGPDKGAEGHVRQPETWAAWEWEERPTAVDVSAHDCANQVHIITWIRSELCRLFPFFWRIGSAFDPWTSYAYSRVAISRLC